MEHIYQDELFCDNCNDDTLHTVTVQNSQQREDKDTFTCTKCKYSKIGCFGEYKILSKL